MSATIEKDIAMPRYDFMVLSPENIQTLAETVEDTEEELWEQYHQAKDDNRVVIFALTKPAS